MKFQCYTLGCKVNQYETQAMQQLLLALGHELVSQHPCDAIIVNTCTVTAVADRKNRTLIHRLRRENPQAVLGVCGCYAQVHTEAVQQLGAQVVSGSGGREEFLQLLLQAVRERQGDALPQPQIRLDNALQRRSFERLPAGGLQERTRAMLKVQDGCNNFCSYCIIPYARGPVRSLPIAEAVAQAQQLAAQGFLEIVVTGIEIASWGWDARDGSCLTDLVEAVCKAVPSVRIRLGSLEPRCIDATFCERLSALPNLCPQFHLSMQSGCDTVLQRMRRKYTAEQYLQSVLRLREAFPDCAVTTDWIVGFPQETAEEFAESLVFVQRCGFAAMHIFPYSRRPGTPADALDGQIPHAVKVQRAAAAAAVAAKMSIDFRTALIGSTQQVLFEQMENGYFTGHAKNGTKVYLHGENLHNVCKAVCITALHADGVLA